jgi:hypothetical protein
MPTHKSDLSKLSISQLSQITGFAYGTTKRRLVGLDPVAADGRTLFFASRKALAQIYGQPDDPREARTRLDTLQGDLVEHELTAKRKEVLPIELIAEKVDNLFTNVYRRLAAMPHKLAPYLVGIKTPAEAYEILDAQIREALEELADTNVAELIDRIE